MSEKLSPFDITKTINMKSGRLITDNSYTPFVINKIFSNTRDSIMYANYANQFTSNTDTQLAYDFYYHGLPKASRFGKWNKPPKEDDEDVIEYVQDYFKYNRQKAIDVIACFSEDVIKEIKDDIKHMNKTVEKVTPRKGRKNG